VKRSARPLRDGLGSARTLRGPTPIILALAIQLSLAGTVLSAALTQEGATSQEESQTSTLIPVPPATHIDTSSFVLDDLAGAHHELAKTRADMVLVHFFATWCEPCREELPALQRLVARSDASDISVLVVSVGEPDDRVRRFFAAMPLSLPVLLDRDRQVAKEWRVQTLPSTFVLNRELEPRLMVEGEFAWDRIKPEELSDAVGLAQKLPHRAVE
jgi:thiol-disulfide isomerase/thioredoxin